ncbi:MAG: tRNA guanosine(34) transglycosylase Tgt [Planctomycetota bacterium]
MPRSPSFRLEAVDPATGARAGVLATPHGEVPTPLFLPVGTRGTVKGIRPEELAAVGARMLLANTYHLHLRPGEEVVASLGGLHALMGWEGPILTDSGGYQVFSLSHLTAIDEEGATLRSVVDGRPIRLTPESVVLIQRTLGADVIMALDHCPADPTDRRGVAEATERTHRWLDRGARAWRAGGGGEAGPALFGIVQGGVFPDLRRASAAAVVAHDLPGYAIGGVSTGEDRAARLAALDAVLPLLPPDRPRYLMGVGTPLDFVEAVLRGVDMFDCVTPTRHGRNHQAFTPEGRINLRNHRWRRDPGPLDPGCDCPCCRRFSRGALRHLATSGEMLAGILLSLHNLRFFLRLLEEVRAAIVAGDLSPVLARVRRPEMGMGS